MEVLVVIAVMTVIGGVASVWAVGERRKTQKAVTAEMRRVAKHFGLEFAAVKGLAYGAVQGIVRGVRVNIRTVVLGNAPRLEVLIEALIPRSIALGRRHDDRWIGKAELLTGHPSFDRVFRVAGDEANVRAVMAAPSRQLLLDGPEVFVSDGTVAHDAGVVSPEPPDLVALVDRLIALGKALAEPPRKRASLTANATEDPEPDVRANNLRVLLRSYPRSQVVETARQALTDPSPGVRLHAAIYFDEEDHTPLRQLIESHDVPAQVRLEAIKHVAAKWKPSEAGAVLSQLVGMGPARMERVVITELGRLQHRSSVPRLVARLKGTDPITGLAVIRALAAIRDLAAEPALIWALGHHDEPVAVAAADALGDFGTLAAVEPLMDRVKGVFRDEDLKIAARRAINRIQARSGSAEGGRLSMADATDDGQLSLSNDGGGLALADEEE